MKKLDFRIRVEVDQESGKTNAVYLQVRKGKAARVHELVEGVVFVNYGVDNVLLGVEILSPVSIAVFDRVARSEPKEVKEFLVNTLPREMARSA